MPHTIVPPGLPSLPLDIARPPADPSHDHYDTIVYLLWRHPHDILRLDCSRKLLHAPPPGPFASHPQVQERAILASTAVRKLNYSTTDRMSIAAILLYKYLATRPCRSLYTTGRWRGIVHMEGDVHAAKQSLLGGGALHPNRV